MRDKYDKVALIAVDVQNDFCPSGSLAVPDGDEVIKPINSLRKWVLGKNGLYFATRDWHPAESTHFDVWPSHCVAGTLGAEFHPALNIKGSSILSKGMGQTEDAYSGFDARDERNKSLDVLLDTYRRRDHLALIIGGLATDYCVRATVLDAIRQHNTDVFVPIDAVRAVNINPEDGDDAIEEMMASGAMICESTDILNGVLINVEKEEL
jgi:nicotinamidase/pyrazinamidase